MSFRSSVRTFAIALSLAAAAPLAAQSLAEVARQEEARRKEIRQPAKVYTNKDLATVPPPSAPATAPAPAPGEKPAPPAAADTKDAANEPLQADTKDKDTVKNQKYWSGRMRDLQAQVDRDLILAEALQSRINALTTDFSALDDPAQRAAVGRNRQKAIDELDRMKLTIQRTRKAIADLEEEARRAAVPPGWLR
jgi:hypothetical protein